MSYLSPFRLHFAGRFKANIPTGNNDVANLAPGSRRRPAAGYNRLGDGSWRLIGCRVTAAFDATGRKLGSKDDAVLACLVADSDRSAPAKLVDLDPQQQLAPTIYGLEVRICDVAGETLVRGKFTPASMTALFRNRVSSAKSPDGQLGAAFQSVLEALEWGEIARSPWLQALRAATSESGRMSIKFNLDSFNTDWDSADFAIGRIVGTIGPAAADEPKQMVLGRHLLYQHTLNHAVAILDPATRKIWLDLGHSLPMAAPFGPPADVGEMTLQCQLPGKDPLVLGAISYRDAGWYERSAAIVELPADRPLTNEEFTAAENHPLQIVLPEEDEFDPVALAEIGDGLYARADDFVFRLSPEEETIVEIYVTRFGQRLAGAQIMPALENERLQQRGGPSSGSPAAVIDIEKGLTVTDMNGIARSTLKVHDAGAPRRSFGFDGQVYALRYEVVGTLRADEFPPAIYDIVSVRVWDYFDQEARITWGKTVRPILAYYKRFFPVMDRFVDLTSQREIRARRDLLLLAFKLDIDDPNYMPVTRDLSPAKRAAIVRWLENLKPEHVALSEEPRKKGRVRRYFHSGAHRPAASDTRFKERSSQTGKAAAVAAQRVTPQRPAP